MKFRRNLILYHIWQTVVRQWVSKVLNCNQLSNSHADCPYSCNTRKIPLWGHVALADLKWLAFANGHGLWKYIICTTHLALMDLIIAFNKNLRSCGMFQSMYLDSLLPISCHNAITKVCMRAILIDNSFSILIHSAMSAQWYCLTCLWKKPLWFSYNCDWMNYGRCTGCHESVHCYSLYCLAVQTRLAEILFHTVSSFSSSQCLL